MVSYALIAEDAKPPGGQLLAVLHPNLRKLAPWPFWNFAILVP
jgi:hypothetical protein